MKISRGLFRQDTVDEERPRVGSKKPVQQGHNPFVRGAYIQYVSTEKGRERRCRLFSTDP